MNIEQPTLIWIARIIFFAINATCAYGLWCFLRRERVITLPKQKPYSPPNISLPEKNIVIKVTAKPGRIFDNQQLFEEMQKLGFHYGENNVFEYYVPNTKYIAFSVINIRPPHIFSQDPHEMPPTNGLVAVMKLPVADGDNQVEHFHLMLTVADELRANLDAQLCDAHRSLLTDKQLLDIQKEINVFEQQYAQNIQNDYQLKNN